MTLNTSYQGEQKIFIRHSERGQTALQVRGVQYVGHIVGIYNNIYNGPCHHDVPNIILLHNTCGRAVTEVERINICNPAMTDMKIIK